jgi:hypothetical protein
MKDIVELPSGVVKKVKDTEFNLLRNKGYIFYVSVYQGSPIFEYCYYEYYSQHIEDYLNRVSIKTFDDYFGTD